MAAESQIIIQFVPDVTQVESALNELNSTGKVSDNSASAYKEGNAELQKRNQLLQAEAAATQAVDSQQKKNLLTLKDAQKATSQLAGAVIQMTSKEFQDGLKNSGKGIEAYTKSLTQAGTEADKASAKQQSLRQELKALREEMAQLQLAGDSTSKRYIELTTRAGEIKDAISDAQQAIVRAGSDTKNMQYAIDAARGLTAAFSVAHGATLLFGDQNEELQKTMLKVMGAMQILQGLEVINDLLTREYVKTALSRLTVTEAQTVATTAQTAATEVETVATEAATVAQEGLNTAVKLSPIGWLVAVIAGAVTAWGAYKIAVGDATEAERKKNEEEKNTFDNLVKIADLLNNNSATNVRISATEQELQLAKARGAKAEEVYAIESRLSDLRTIQAARNKGYYAEEIANIGIYEAKLESLYTQQKAATNKGSSEQKKALDTEIALYEAKRNKAIEVQDAYNKAVSDSAALEITHRKETNLRILQDHKATIDARIAKTKEGSAAELNAKIADIEADKNIQLANTTLTQAERYRITAQAERQIADLKKAYNNKVATETITLEIQKYQNILEKAKIYYGQYSDAAEAAQKAVLIKQAEAEKISLQQSVETEEYKAAKAIEIESGLQIKIRELNKQFLQKKFEDEQAYRIALADMQINATRNAASNPLLNNAKKQILETQALNLELAKLEDDRAAIHLKAINKMYATDKEYKIALLKNEDEISKKKQDLLNQELTNMKLVYDSAKQLGMETEQALFTIISANIQSELNSRLSALDKQKNEELSVKNLTENQKKQIQDKYDKEAARLKNEAARKERAAQIAQAVAEGALAVIKALASAPPPFDAILAGIAAASVAVQIAKITSTPLPQYAKGTDNSAPGWKWVGEQGPELIYTKGGDKILSNNKSMQVAKTWETQIVPSDPYAILAGNIPANHIQTLSDYSMRSNGTAIDYDKLAQAIHKNMPEINTTVVNNSIDEHGVRSFIQKGNSRTEILNKTFKYQ